MKFRASRPGCSIAAWAICIPKPRATTASAAAIPRAVRAWANLYYRFALVIQALDEGAPDRVGLRYPGIEAGIEGVRWVENCVRSADQGGVWVDYR